MKVVIIEDEPLVANDLANCILKVDNKIQIMSILPSIVESINWFNNNENPDLVFSDIHLTDGLSFEIFKNIPCSIPVIFCTAYDEYALKAFKANGVDYILKPITKAAIAEALNKYTLLKKNMSKDTLPYENISKLFTKQSSDTTVLGYNKSEIFPINISDIAVIFIENELTYIVTLDEKKYTANKNLEEFEKLTENEFYRASRKYLVNRKAIKKVHKCPDYKHIIFLKINFDDTINVRKEKVPEFLNWLTKNQ